MGIWELCEKCRENPHNFMGMHKKKDEMTKRPSPAGFIRHVDRNTLDVCNCKRVYVPLNDNMAFTRKYFWNSLTAHQIGMYQ